MIPGYFLSIAKQALVSPLALTALLFFAALLATEAAVRMLRAPRICALVVAGCAIGLWRQHNPIVAAMPLPRVLLDALAMILLFDVGQRVPLGWIRANPWLLAASLAEAAAAFGAVFGALELATALPPLACAFVGVVGMAASPITIASVAKELGARGQVSERALLFSTLSSVYAVLAMKLLMAAYLAAAHARLGAAAQPLIDLLGSLALGAAAAACLRLYAAVARWRGTGAAPRAATFGRPPPAHDAASDPALASVVACLCVFLFACAPPLGLSPTLAALFFGMAAQLMGPSRRLFSYEAAETGAALALGYFILLGACLAPLDSWQLAAVAALLAVARTLAKVAANALLATPSALRPRKGALLGVALAPLSSLALALAVDIAAHPGLEAAARLASGTVLLCAVLGPLLTQTALRAAGEPTRRAA